MKYQHGGDIYSLSVKLDFSANINPLGLPQGVREELARCFKGDACAVYPDNQCRALKKALGESLRIPSSWIICGNGAADLIFGLAAALKPRRGLVAAPSFAEYEQALLAFGACAEHFFLREENGFDPDIQGMCQRVQKADEAGRPYDLVFLCNPNNPTGVPVERSAVELLARECARCNTVLVVDECFCDFLQEPGRCSALPLLKQYPNVFVLKAFTKLYAMAGLRLGYGVCSDENLLERLCAVRQPWSVSGPAQRAGEAALKEQAYVERTRELIETERLWLAKRLKDKGLIVYDSRANYIFFKDPTEAGISPWPIRQTQYKGRLYEELLQRGILVRSCANYPGLDASYYRVCVKIRRDNEALVKTIGEILRDGDTVK